MDILSFFLSSYGIFLIVCILAVFAVYKFGYAPYHVFESQGIPGPKPKPFIGNLHLMMQYKDNQFALSDMLQKTYGNIYGLYFATRPFLFISDLDAIREVAVKKFDKFINRVNQSGGFRVTVDGKGVDGIFAVHGDDWRKRRHALTPAFSGHKMKLMEPLIKESIDCLVKKIELAANNGNTLEVLDLYSKMTMEVILSTAFGRSVDVQAGRGGQVYKAACGVFAAFTGSSSIIRMAQMILMCFPFLDCVVQPLINRSQFGADLNYLTTTSVQMVRQRKEQGKLACERKDLLQHLVDASSDGDDDPKSKLTTGEIVADAVGFLLAGYETTSVTLTFATYLLAANPEVQEKLAKGIDEYFDSNPNKSMYDAVHEIDYLDMVVCETLRIYPPAPGIVRLCNEDCTIGDMKISRGCQVMLMVRLVHYNPDIWPQPEKFIPERFNPEEKENRHPCAYLPFGLGPRNCVGMRFALMEAKMALIEIVRNFRIQLAPETKVPLQVELGHVLRVKDGLYVTVHKRHP